jgi:predicted phage-related endonuclease
MYRFQVEKPEHGSADWLRIRWADREGNRRISASVAAAVHGEGKYTTAADLASELMADNPPQPLPPTKDMERGNRMEPMLIQWVAETEGINLITPDVMYLYEDGACRMIATLDAIDPDGIPYEVKSTRKRWDGQLPRHWHWQGVQQAICAGSDRVEWIVFDGDMDLIRFTQNISSDDIEIHKQRVREFLSAIDDGNLPDTVTLEYSMVERMYPQSEPRVVSLSRDQANVVAQLISVQTMIKGLEEQESSLKADVAAMLQDAEYGTYEGESMVSWKTVRRTSLDTKALESAHPALVEKFRKTSQYRVMKTTRRK